MNQYNYHVTAFTEGNEVELRTNDVRQALHCLLHTINEGTYCHLLDGYTGEVLVIGNNPDGDDYATDEMTLMMQGMIFERLEGEKPDLSEPEKEDAMPDWVKMAVEELAKQGLPIFLPSFPS